MNEDIAGEDIAGTNWEQKYHQLRSDFDSVCAKYNINQCCSCSKYRISKQCLCGKKYCDKCFSESDLEPRNIECTLCSANICGRCTSIFCDSGHSLCREHNMYECTAGCGNLICEKHIGNNTCAVCLMTWCKVCIESHACRPKRCSCGELVYPVNDTYAFVTCTRCSKTSCQACEHVGIKHRAYHSIIPFLILAERNELPAYLPLELRIKIWEFLLTK